MIFSGLLAATGLLLVCFKILGRLVITHQVWFDILITSILMITLAGTYSGMMAAMIGGLATSIFLMFLKSEEKTS